MNSKVTELDKGLHRSNLNDVAALECLESILERF